MSLDGNRAGNTALFERKDVNASLKYRYRNKKQH